MLTLTQIADSINKILTLLEDTKAPTKKKGITQTENEEKYQKENKLNKVANNPEPKEGGPNEKNVIIDYLKGPKFSLKELTVYDKSNTSQELKPSIKLALEFWSLDGLKPKTYFTYFSKVEKDKYLNNNSILKDFLKDEIKKKSENKYPPNIKGFKTLTLSKFIDKAK